ncbi:MAG: hypothetical protein JJE42_04005 [Burkholderiales bacterium]|nr:hypothetical protein [Burkholderiales bacterium]
MDIAFWSATKLIRALRAKKIGALELLDHYAARIARAVWIGVQIVGQRYGDLTSIRVAQLIELEYYAIMPRPV